MPSASTDNDRPREFLEVVENVMSQASRLTINDAGSASKTAASFGDLTSTFGAPALAHNEDGDDGPSLMEQMMEEALACKKEKNQAAAAEQKRLKKSFGGGLKKGFFSSAPASGRGGRGASNAKPPSEAKPAAPQRAPSETIPTITGSAASTNRLQRGGSSRGDSSSNSGHGRALDSVSKAADAVAAGLVLPEVQEAMRADAVGPVGTGTAAQLAKGEWLTPDLLQKISNNPRLLAALQDPRFTRALELISTEPKRAAELLQHSEEARSLLAEFGALLGGHFEQLAKKAETETAEQQEKRQADATVAATAAEAAAAAAAGPIAAAALRRQREVERAGAPAPPLPTAAEQAQMDAVLSDAGLRTLLMDPELQAVLQDCGRPGRLAYYMTQRPDIAAKIRRLADAGLVQLQS